MSFAANKRNPYYAQPTFVPASPVPSYQYSSQSSSGSNSPGGSSSSDSITCSNFSISTGPSSVSHKIEVSRSSNEDASLHAPPSPSPSQGTHTGGTITIFKEKETSEYGEDDDTIEGIDDFKGEYKTSRERRANQRALTLLESTAGANVSELTKEMAKKFDPKQQKKLIAKTFDDKHIVDGVKECKTKHNELCERWANKRALALLAETTRGTSNNRNNTKLSSSGFQPCSGTNLTARQKEIKRFVENQKIKDEYMNNRHGKEAMAESSRKPKKTENNRDPETVAGMKCQLDIEREKKARKKALLLIKFGGCIA